MPVTYSIDHAAGMVRMECSGILTNQEIIDGAERLYTDPERLPGMPSLVNCRGVYRLLVTQGGLEAAATLVTFIADRRRQPWAVAVIAPQEEMFQLARAYGELRAGSPEHVRVFRDAVEAEGWVRTQTV